MAGRSRIVVQIVGDASSLERAFKSASRSSQRLSVGLGTIAKGAIGFTAITASIDALGSAMRGAVAEFSEQQKVAAQTAAVISSTGSAANVTAAQVDKLAASISAYSGIDDEAVQAGQNLLLTFPEIRNEVGKGNRVFDQATRTVADLAVALGTDTKRAALQVGKALNDPARGYARLQRIGVAFSKSQIAQIKNFQATGRVAQAQKVILAELNREFGGSARALGKTIPGQLNILRETLRNVGGELVGRLAPAFTTALQAATGFVQRFAEADGIRAKLRIAWEGVEAVGRDLFATVVRVLEQIDWPASVQVVQDGLVRGLRRVGDQLRGIDFSEVGRVLGEAISTGAEGAAEFLRTTDWGAVGNAIVKGIGDFLRGVNWGRLIRGVAQLIVAAWKAAADILEGAATAAGRGIVRALGRALGAGASYIRQKALELALQIVKALDFEVFGKSIIPGMGALRRKITRELDEIKRKAQETAKAIADAAAATAAVTGNPGVRGTAGSSAAATAPPPPAPAASRAPVARAAADAAAAATEGARATVTAAERAAEAARKARDAFNQLLDGLQLGLERAQITGRLDDDLAQLRKIEASLRQRLTVEKASVDLQRQLLQTRQQIAGIRTEQRQRDQFRALGLSASGDTPIPGTAALRRQLGRVSDAVKGSFLDTGKTRSLISSIRRVLSGGLGQLTDDVRSKIKDLLDGVDQQLRDRERRPSSFRPIGTDKLLEGLGLTPDQMRAARSRLSRVSANGTIAGQGASAFGVSLAGTRGGVTITGPITVVASDPDEMLRGIQRRASRGTAQTRGSLSGSTLGLR